MGIRDNVNKNRLIRVNEGVSEVGLGGIVGKRGREGADGGPFGDVRGLEMSAAWAREEDLGELCKAGR